MDVHGSAFHDPCPFAIRGERPAVGSVQTCNTPSSLPNSFGS